MNINSVLLYISAILLVGLFALIVLDGASVINTPQIFAKIYISTTCFAIMSKIMCGIITKG